MVKVKPLKFRVKPHPKRKEYYNVLIFDTQADMLAHWNSIVSGDTPFQAHVVEWAAVDLVNGCWKKSDNIGEIIFHEGFLGAGVVAHEMTHAALYSVCKRRNGGAKFHLTEKDDERLAFACGEMCRQFWTKYLAKRS